MYDQAYQDYYEDVDFSRYPRCCSCGCRIVEGSLYDIEGDFYCEECLDHNFKRDPEDYYDERRS